MGCETPNKEECISTSGSRDKTMKIKKKHLKNQGNPDLGRDASLPDSFFSLASSWCHSKVLALLPPSASPSPWEKIWIRKKGGKGLCTPALHSLLAELLSSPSRGAPTVWGADSLHLCEVK